jgi:VWFA-related protein
LSALYERTVEALTKAQVSVYPVDVRGLVNPVGIADASRRDAPAPEQAGNNIWAFQKGINSLTRFADMTGGNAFANTNDLAACFKRAADDASSYYLVTYYLGQQNNRSGWRTLNVKVEKRVPRSGPAKASSSPTLPSTPI